MCATVVGLGHAGVRLLRDIGKVLFVGTYIGTDSQKCVFPNEILQYSMLVPLSSKCLKPCSLFEPHPAVLRLSA